MCVEERTKRPFAVLYAENHSISAKTMKLALEQSGDFVIVVAEDGLRAWTLYNQHDFDLCLIDVHMPGLNGTDLGAKIREVNSIIPIVYISVDAHVETKIAGFEIGGADDYIEKPVDLPLLIYKMKALIGRAVTQAGIGRQVAFDKYTYNPMTYSIVYNNKTFHLNQKEATVLNKLIMQMNKTVTKEELIILAFKRPDKRSIRPIILKLISCFMDSDYVKIRTIRGVGYSLEVPRDMIRYF
ncbi:response regulator transcription factor [Chitinophaga eiseniae]|uniref:Response regulator transcription factor n=1 Tax=Chitinophaga eiseniae TaxID=634771 RepID=A0A847S7B0_9BACT|nr:response regulator transcription factor [Chitinophaga eiseniae]NLR79130.1 response regulator transcription factor [Chitinophaga eiseniae]